MDRDPRWITAQRASDDPRGHAPFRAWGCRRAPRQHKDNAVPDYGRINPRSIASMARLPKTAYDVDPVTRRPDRSAGGWTLLPAYHQRYYYYSQYGNAGRNAISSHQHNFPHGQVPLPERLYATQPDSKVAGRHSAGPRPTADVGTDP